MRYRCPVCFFDRLPYPPADYHICPCCGTEFGNDDAEFSHQQLREMWVAGGANWFFGKAPEHWNPWVQFLKARLWFPATGIVPEIALRVQSNAVPRIDLQATAGAGAMIFPNALPNARLTAVAA